METTPEQRAVPTGKHLGNVYDPSRDDARFTHWYRSLDPTEHPEEWRQHLNWIHANVLGRPQATDAHTVEQLEAMGMVGIYAPS